MLKVKLTGIFAILTIAVLLGGCSAREIIQQPLFDVQPIEEQNGISQKMNQWIAQTLTWNL